jgi:hypothetical protein
VIGTGELTPGHVISFTVGLNEDDDGGSRDDHMIWQGNEDSLTDFGEYAVPEASRAGNAVKLDWADYGGPYDVRFSTTNPLLHAADGRAQWLPVPASNTATLVDQLGDPGTHHFYVVQVKDCVDGWISSGRAGEFEFELVPGAR